MMFFVLLVTFPARGGPRGMLREPPTQPSAGATAPGASPGVLPRSIPRDPPTAASPGASPGALPRLHLPEHPPGSPWAAAPGASPKFPPRPRPEQAESPLPCPGHPVPVGSQSPGAAVESRRTVGEWMQPPTGVPSGSRGSNGGVRACVASPRKG